MHIFKIWSSDRITRVFVALEDSDEILLPLIVKASEKMKVNGSVICLESDGTRIEESEVLKIMKNEILLLLQPGEIWRAADDVADTSSTITVTSADLNRSFTSFSAESNTTTDNDCNDSIQNSEFSWNLFKIPWDRMRSETLKDIEALNRSKRSVSDVIHVTVDAILQVKRDIPSKAIKIIANKIISKYPNVFRDVDEDGVVLGDGSHTVYSKIKEHIKYLNRPHKRKSDPLPDTPLAKKMKMLSSRAGCSNWQPNIPSEEPAVEIQDKLKEFDGKPEDEIISLLEKAYPHQRLFLNQQHPELNEIQKEWPVIFSKLGYMWHYKMLMGHDITTLTDQMLNKYERVTRLGINRKIIVPPLPELNDDDKLKTMISVICNYFNENIGCIYKIVKDDSVQYESNAPHVIKLDSLWHIIIEGTRVLHVSSFKEAVEAMFALYYILNLEYCKKAANTLETMQRYFLKIHPDQGSKNKKSSTCKTKIIGFLNKLREV